jgi:hypothetical protein
MNSRGVIVLARPTPVGVCDQVKRGRCQRDPLQSRHCARSRECVSNLPQPADFTEAAKNRVPDLCDTLFRDSLRTSPVMH